MSASYWSELACDGARIITNSPRHECFSHYDIRVLPCSRLHASRCICQITLRAGLKFGRDHMENLLDIQPQCLARWTISQTQPIIYLSILNPLSHPSSHIPALRYDVSLCTQHAFRYASHSSIRDETQELFQVRSSLANEGLVGLIYLWK
jgi:hypothetical protein